MNLLHTIGLMTRAEHERLIERARDEEQHTIASLKAQLNDARRGFVDQQAKFKRAAAERDDMKMYRDDWQQKHNAVVGKLKRAATDLAAQAKEIAAYKEGAKALHRGLDEYMVEINRLHAEIASLRPDAEAMRKKRAADRKRMAGKRGKA